MKKTTAIIACILAILLLPGCATPPIEIDPEGLAHDLRQNVSFQDELTQLDGKMIKKLYNIEDFVSAYVYVSGGATAEEIAVMELKDEESAKQALEKGKARIATQKESYASYIPKEIRKLDNAVIRQVDKYLILCVSEGTEAKKIIERYLK